MGLDLRLVRVPARSQCHTAHTIDPKNSGELMDLMTCLLTGVGGSLGCTGCERGSVEGPSSDTFAENNQRLVSQRAKPCYDCVAPEAERLLGDCASPENPGVAVLPKQGRLVFWYNYHDNGTFHGGAMHAGCPVLVSGPMCLHILHSLHHYPRDGSVVAGRGTSIVVAMSYLVHFFNSEREFLLQVGEKIGANLWLDRIGGVPMLTTHEREENV